MGRGLRGMRFWCSGAQIDATTSAGLIIRVYLQPSADFERIDPRTHNGRISRTGPVASRGRREGGSASAASARLSKRRAAPGSDGATGSKRPAVIGIASVADLCKELGETRHEWVPGRWWDLIDTSDDGPNGNLSFFENGSSATTASASECDRARWGSLPTAGTRPSSDGGMWWNQGGSRPGALDRLDPERSPEEGRRTQAAPCEAPAPANSAEPSSAWSANRRPKEVFRPARFAGRGRILRPLGARRRQCIPRNCTVSCDFNAKRTSDGPMAKSRPGSAATNRTAQRPSSMDRDVCRADGLNARFARPR